MYERVIDGDEAALITRTQAGDVEAFGRLYEEFAPQIYSYALRYSRDLAEDITADVFLKAFDGIGKYQLRGLPFSAWLYRIAKNCITDNFRKNPELTTSLEQSPHIMNNLRGESGFESRVDTRIDIENAFANLTPEQSEVVKLRLTEDMSFKEIMKTTGKTRDSLKHLYSRGLTNMKRTALPDYEDEWNSGSKAS